MAPVRIEYEVKSPTGRLVFTTDDADIALRWARDHSGPLYRLSVERVVTVRIKVPVYSSEAAA